MSNNAENRENFAACVKKLLKKAVCLALVISLCVLSMASCSKQIEKDVYDGQAQKKVGALLKEYDELISSGEYTLKVTVNEVIGGESVPIVTTSIHRGGRVDITVEESYGSCTEYTLDNGMLYYKTESGEQQSIEYDPYILNITLFDSEVMYVNTGSMTLYGINYVSEEYTDADGNKFLLLFKEKKLERKLVYKDSNEYTVYTIELTPNTIGGEDGV